MLVRKIMTCALVAWSAFAYASGIADPQLFLQNKTQIVLSELKDIPENQTSEVYNLIDKEIVPIVDIEYMSRWVAGRKAWSQASAEQKAKFQEVFQKLMIKTYSSTLMIFKDRDMQYSRPPRVDYQKAKNIPIYCEIKQPNKESIQVIYQLRLVNKDWKIFDVLVEGVSMLKGLQAQYEQTIAQKGLSGGIEAMEAKLLNPDPVKIVEKV